LREREGTPSPKGKCGSSLLAEFPLREPSTKRDLDPLWGKRKREGGWLETSPLHQFNAEPGPN